MSLRRFLAYFLAVTAGSTVAFASFLITPSAAVSEAARQEANLESSSNPETTRLFQEILARQRRKLSVKKAQAVLTDYRLSD